MGRYSEFSSNIKTLSRSLKKAQDESASGAAESWAQGMVQVMAESNPGGLIYWYPGLGWTRASAPGQPPAIQTGEYARSLKHQKVRDGEYEAGSPEWLGQWLEKGTDDMAPRPHVFRAYQRNKRDISRALYESWEKLA
jgi:hypothetical protein